MIKKVSILTLLLLFFVSTTGLPLTIHFCNMADKEVSETCAMHMPQKQLMDMHENCAGEDSSEKAIRMDMQNCCNTETIIAGVKDSFITNKTEIQNNLSPDIPLILDNSQINLQHVFSANIIADNSPPPIQSHQLYLINSTFLI